MIALAYPHLRVPRDTRALRLQYVWGSERKRIGRLSRIVGWHIPIVPDCQFNWKAVNDAWVGDAGVLVKKSDETVPFTNCAWGFNQCVCVFVCAFVCVLSVGGSRPVCGNGGQVDHVRFAARSN